MQPHRHIETCIRRFAARLEAWYLSRTRAMATSSLERVWIAGRQMHRAKARQRRKRSKSRSIFGGSDRWRLDQTAVEHHLTFAIQRPWLRRQSRSPFLHHVAIAAHDLIRRYPAKMTRYARAVESREVSASCLCNVTGVGVRVPEGRVSSCRLSKMPADCQRCPHTHDLYIV